MGEIFECAMVICFGISWPTSLYKSIKSKTAKGKSLVFECFIFLGYICGIAGKLITHNITYVFIFYLINICMITADLIFYFRNVKLDKARDAMANGS